MNTTSHKNKQSPRSHRPRASAVFAAAFLAGAAAAVGVNRALDVHIAQSKPKVESEPIFVALRGLPQGSPVTVWDVALRDWPKAMLPTSAVRPHDSFEGMILKHPLREGQPLLTVQLVKAADDGAGRLAADATPAAAPGPAIPAASTPATTEPQTDLWAPGTPAEQPAAVQPAPEQVASAPVSEPAVTEAETVAAPAAAGEPAAEPIVTESTDAPQPAPQEVAVEPIVAPVTVASAPVSTDVEPTAPVRPAPRQTSRFLVVPERIALQADRSFVPPSAGAPAVEEVVQPVVQNPVEVPQTQIRQGSKTPPKRPPQRSAANAAQKPAAPNGNQNSFGSMFPNLSAGVNAVGEQLDMIKQERTPHDAVPAKAGAAQQQRSQQKQQQPAQRSAFLPFFRGQ